jgi:hypothetical protein
MASKQVTSNAEVYDNRSEVSLVENSVQQDVNASLPSKIYSGLRVFTISEVADILKCKERTVRHHLFTKRNLRNATFDT